MIRIMSVWTALAGFLNVTELTFAPSRPTTTTTRPASRWRRCPTTSPRERARAHAQQRRRWSPSPRQRRRLLRLHKLQKKSQRPRRRRRRSTPLRRRRMPRTHRRRRTQPRRRHPLPRTQPRPQPRAETPQENAGRRPAYSNNAQWPTERETMSWPTTSLTVWLACCVSSVPRDSPPPHCLLVLPHLLFPFPVSYHRRIVRFSFPL